MGFFTLIEQVALTPFAVALILVVPAFSAVMVPLASILAMDGCSLFHEIDAVGVTVAFKVYVFPT